MYRRKVATHQSELGLEMKGVLLPKQNLGQLRDNKWFHTKMFKHKDEADETDQNI
jgi:hypothetical protein